MGDIWPFLFTLLLSASVVPCKTDVPNARTFIVRVQNDLKPSRFSNIKAWYKSTLINSLGSSTYDSAQTQDTGHDLLHVYNSVFHGFSARLSPQQAEKLTDLPEILAVFPDRLIPIQTTRTPQFLGLKDEDTGASTNGIIRESDSGSHVIIGMIDTGVWPERLSFNDKDLGPIPSHWRGKCIGGEKFPKTLCNRKLIGARYFADGYFAHYGDEVGETKELIKSARDTVGHGTHTASTAAGRHVNNASFLGFADGVAIGVAPKARIAVYKVCGMQGCVTSDVLAGIDAAVEDGVDIISSSLGGEPMPYHEDVIAIGSFGAIEKGIIFSAAAGNSGPNYMSVTNTAPWITTVGASTIDRKFPAELVLEDGRVITGSSLFQSRVPPEAKYVPLIYAGNASTLGRIGIGSEYCYPNTLDPNVVRGKIVVCDRGEVSRVVASVVVQEAGGVGVVIANVEKLGQGTIADAYIHPGLAISESDRTIVLKYIESSPNPRATLRFNGTTLVGVKPAPTIAIFSSRGPNSISPHVLKPDVVAPGVNILAAWPDGIPPTELPSDLRRLSFNIISGTSMSCPHVAGVVALLKGAHPDWSPAMIKSSLMTTAYTYDHDGKALLDEKDFNASDVFEMGAGHVDPEKAVDPGLVYDLTVDDYLNFLCASDYSSDEIKVITTRSVACNGTQKHTLWDLNYPAILVFFNESAPSKSEIVVKRVVTHVSDGASTYRVKISSPKDVIVTVDHKKMVFLRKDQKHSYTVRIRAKNVGLPRGGKKATSEFGHLTWTDGKHQVTSPIVVTWTP
ncbi:subtilisin-like protease SBT1.5 [Juglans microcarpa x Juglans regia]|uniref:subtilisin-like protease SBT1.5 n=1 Tax=Juglans microcarpa x Juglans regia TaxID=2249226 RepID=UPI001B7F3818|nr:subtilisin-like protease SBT1.5 [Juglans microcarpa x Juglans regia]